MCRMCGIYPSQTECNICGKGICTTPTCHVVRCESCYDIEMTRNVNDYIDEAITRDRLLQFLARAANLRSVQTQSQTTYTSVRGVATPRFALTSPRFGCYSDTGLQMPAVPLGRDDDPHGHQTRNPATSVLEHVRRSAIEEDKFAPIEDGNDDWFAHRRHW